jgi:hypothetical protein
VEQSGSEWFLALVKPLDLETLYEVLIIDMRHGSSSVFVSVSIVDVNDEQVQIIGREPELEASYPEKEPRDKLITKILTFDKDKVDQQPGAITFNLEVRYCVRKLKY